MIKEFEFDKENPLVKNSFAIANNIISAELSQNNFIKGKKFLVPQSEYNELKGFLRPGEFHCTDLIDTCIQDVSQLVLSHGFSLDVSDEKSQESNCEFHYGISKNQFDIFRSPFDIHKDDYGGTNYPVITTIIYLDVTCDGGELCFYDNKGNIMSKIKTQNPSVNTCKVVIFDGSILHKPADYSNGKRFAISFQLPRKLIKTPHWENCFSWILPS